MKMKFLTKNDPVLFFAAMVTLGMFLSSLIMGTSVGAADFLDKLKRPFTKDADDSSGSTKSSKTSNAGQERAKTPLHSEISKGRMQERSGDWDKARNTYEALLRKFPNDPDVHHRLGVVADQQRRFTEAQENFMEALRVRPRDAEIHNDLGYNFFLQGKLDKAESALLKATQIEPRNARYRNNLGLVLGHKEKYQEAFTEFSKVGSEADAFYNLAFVYSAKEQNDKAKDCFRRALATNPQHELSRKALQAFELYESTKHDEKDDREFDSLSNKGNLIPYQEGSEKGTVTGMNGTGGPRPMSDPSVQRASFSEPATASAARQPSATSRSMHNQAQGMLDRNMSSKREALPPQN